MNLHSEGYDNSVERKYFVTTSFYKHYTDYTSRTQTQIYRSTIVENKTRLFIEHIRRGDKKKHK